jgi:hypothetical protein
LTDAEEERYYGFPEVLVLPEQCSSILEKQHNAQQKSAYEADKEANTKDTIYDRGEIFC